jgi:hypothetical protein
MATTIRLSRRQELVNATVTLDGEPAKVRGYNRPYASVRSSTRSVEFAWETVEHIVTTRNGAFKS